MKKTLFTLITILSIYYIISLNVSEITKIPDEAIRIRVLANSNSDYDQSIKKEVSGEVEKYMYSILKNTKGIDEARLKINNNLKEVDKIVDNIFTKENYKSNYNINFGLNYFPEKEYKGIKYDEGYYESLLITLGEGKGDNWWCVLFPPFCLIEAEENNDIEYTSFVKELIDKYM